MSRLLKGSILVLLLWLVSVVTLPGCTQSEQNPQVSKPEPEQSPQVGKTAPDFQLPSLDGKAVSLRDFRGKPVMLNFWASWCGPCRSEMPFFQQIYEDKQWSARGLTILAVNLGESTETVKKFMAESRFNFPVLLDSKQEVGLRYNIRSIPTTLFLDKNGVIQEIKIGAFTGKADIETRLAKIAR